MKVLIAVLFLAGVALAQELPTRPPKPTRPSLEERCKMIAQKCQSVNQANTLKICGSDKQMYTSKCQFMLARCENPSLRVDRNIRHCMGDLSQFSNMTKPTRGPRPTKPSLEDVCQKIKEEGCPDKMNEANIRICDMKGNVYTSKCAFMTARCADPTLRPSRRCRRPQPTSEPTEPAL
ncbi:uncharacterized protein LOC106170267 [Lingula anatina]|uniref:Uncharacterized protein LOC106170267 n=1 Tax=Lingula anatina TaxID=7574 RepID=A0A1S3J5I0_LINAN|nr:uncharacterized protein LOC106170267 [Lingula anatina]|eukprot:XP_013405516.1 uncharacterized protein LOC106170267 [Lingula anatina]